MGGGPSRFAGGRSGHPLVPIDKKSGWRLQYSPVHTRFEEPSAMASRDLKGPAFSARNRATGQGAPIGTARHGLRPRAALEGLGTERAV
jgi:hypothetical protein